MVRTKAPQRPARLPVLPSRHPVRDRLQGLVALLLTLAIAGGVPYLLITFFGPPWPERMPSRDVLFSELDAQSVLSIVAFFVWLAWAHFVLCLLAEIVGEVRGRGLAPRVPLGGGSQGLARRLVAGIALLAGSASVALPVGQAVSAPASTVAAPQSTTGSDLGPTLPVEPASSSLAGLTGARTETGRSGQIVKYTEVLPPDGRNYDCLWDIAERYLGDGLRYKEIYQLNQGVLQPDGKRLSNPDLIYPGWQVRLPADARGAGVHTVELRLADHFRPPYDKTDRVERPSKPDNTRWFEDGRESASKADIVAQGKSQPKPGEHRQTKPGPVRRPVLPDRDTGTAPGESAGPVETVESQDLAEPHTAGPDGVDPVQVGVFGLGGTLLAAGLVLALKRRRGWSLGPGPSSATYRQTEVELRLAADVPTATFVDRALRHLGAVLRQHDQPVPKVVAALVDDHTLTLVLSQDEDPLGPPPPWQTVANGRRWMLRRGYAPDADVDAPSPYPTLVTIGRNADGSIVLVDVAAAPGIASFGGVTGAARDVVGSVAVELATNPWSGGSKIFMVGFGDDLSELAPSRLRYRGSLAAALADVDSDPDGPRILVLSAPPQPEEVDGLSRFAAGPDRAVLVVGDVLTAPWRFVVDDKCRTVNRLLGLEVEAHTINPTQFADLVALFHAAESDARDKARAEQDLPAYASADLTVPAPARIDLLGPVAVHAPGELDPGRAELATEIAAFLASQDYGVHPNVLAGAIWPRGISLELRDAALEHTGRWLGEGAVYADENGRWTLDRTRVRVDWDAFRGLVAQAGTMDDPRGPLASALELVQGPCWSELPAGRYSWLAASGIERRMAEAVIDAALRLAEASLRYDDGELARTALRTGLMFAPASEDLWRATLRLAAHFGDQRDVTTVANQMYAAIARTPHGAEPETDALVDELLPGHRRPRAVA